MDTNRQTPVDPSERAPGQMVEPVLATYRSLADIVNGMCRTGAIPLKSKKINLAAVPLNGCARRLLLFTLAEIEGLSVFGANLSHGTTLDLKDIRDKGIPYQWCTGHDGNRLNDAQRQAYSRAALRLQSLGAVERVTERGRDRVTHLRLTADGLRFALRLAGRCADRSAIAEGLRLTNWGKELAASVRAEQHRDKADTE